MMALYNWLSAIYWTPGPDSSNLIKTENAVPISPENNAKIKYRIPISFALLDKNHLSVQSEIELCNIFKGFSQPSDFSIRSDLKRWVSYSSFLLGSAIEKKI